LEKVEELLRWNGVGGGMSYRRVTKQTELAGCPLEPDDVVCTVMTAANHDPRASDDADEARFDRKRVKSFTFAFGTHRCLGIHFAKMGTKVAVEEWHRRIPNYRLKESVEVIEQVWAGVGYLELPLVWTPGAAA
jgi:cytochrome P450